jgi:hypothetical protein
VITFTVIDTVQAPTPTPTPSPSSPPRGAQAKFWGTWCGAGVTGPQAWSLLASLAALLVLLRKRP